MGIGEPEASGEGRRGGPPPPTSVGTDDQPAGSAPGSRPSVFCFTGSESGAGISTIAYSFARFLSSEQGERGVVLVSFGVESRAPVFDWAGVQSEDGRSDRVGPFVLHHTRGSLSLASVSADVSPLDARGALMRIGRERDLVFDVGFENPRRDWAIPLAERLVWVSSQADCFSGRHTLGFLKARRTLIGGSCRSLLCINKVAWDCRLRVESIPLTGRFYDTVVMPMDTEQARFSSGNLVPPTAWWNNVRKLAEAVVGRV